MERIPVEEQTVTLNKFNSGRV